VSSAQAHVLAICSPSAPAAPAADQVEDQDKATSKAPAPFAAITLKVPAIASIETSNSTNEHPETKGPLATSPPREGETPQPARNTPLEGAQDTVVVPSTNSLQDLINLAIQKDEILPCIPLDDAIAISVEHASANDERKMRDFYGGIIPIGGGSQTNGFRQFLEEELQNTVARFKKEIIVAPPPREIDPQVLVWKGASIFGKLAGTNETWISGLEWDRLGSRILAYKCLWTW
jgi:actin-related protein 8